MFCYALSGITVFGVVKSRGGGGGWVYWKVLFSLFDVYHRFFSVTQKKKILKFLGQDKGETREGLGPINAAIM